MGHIPGADDEWLHDADGTHRSYPGPLNQLLGFNELDLAVEAHQAAHRAGAGGNALAMQFNITISFDEDHAIGKGQSWPELAEIILEEIRSDPASYLDSGRPDRSPIRVQVKPR